MLSEQNLIEADDMQCGTSVRKSANAFPSRNSSSRSKRSTVAESAGTSEKESWAGLSTSFLEPRPDPTYKRYCLLLTTTEEYLVIEVLPVVEATKAIDSGSR